MYRLTEEQVIQRTKQSNLEAIKELNFCARYINDISIIKQMPGIEVLSLSYNSISSLEPLMECTKIRTLFIRNNQIQNIDEITYLKNLPELQELHLSGNPCCKRADYRSYVFRALPTLKILDDLPYGVDKPIEIKCASAAPVVSKAQQAREAAAARKAEEAREAAAARKTPVVREAIAAPVVREAPVAHDSPANREVLPAREPAYAREASETLETPEAREAPEDFWAPAAREPSAGREAPVARWAPPADEAPSARWAPSAIEAPAIRWASAADEAPTAFEAPLARESPPIREAPADRWAPAARERSAAREASSGHWAPPEEAEVSDHGDSRYADSSPRTPRRPVSQSSNEYENDHEPRHHYGQQSPDVVSGSRHAYNRQGHSTLSTHRRTGCRPSNVYEERHQYVPQSPIVGRRQVRPQEYFEWEQSPDPTYYRQADLASTSRRRAEKRISNLLSAALSIVEELDYESLRKVELAVACRLDELEAER